MDIKVLLVEDDEHISNTVGAFLTDAGYRVDSCADGDEAFEKFYGGSYHLVILDIMLPGMNGHELLREFRKLSDTPVLMMTALADDDSQIRAFDAEADDYVIKPFRIQLLLKRAEALLRRSGVLSKEIRLRNLTMHPDEFKAFYGGEEIPLTMKEFEILMLLLQYKGKTLSHETMLSRVWGYDFAGDYSVVHTHIKNIRSKLPESIIKNVRGVGYRIEDGPQ